MSENKANQKQAAKKLNLKIYRYVTFGEQL